MRAWELSGLRSQCASLTQRSNLAGGGEVRTINVGHVTFRVDRHNEDTILTAIQRGMSEILSPRIPRVCSSLLEEVRQGWDSGEGQRRVTLMRVVWCGSAFALFNSTEEQEARVLACALNDRFREAVAPLYASRLKELEHSLSEVTLRSAR
jgi:hypothetical protein